MKKVVVTGATGFIGGQLCRALLEKGIQVYGVGRNKERLEKLGQNPNFHAVYLEFEDYVQMCNVIMEKNFDIFFHMAYYGVNGESKSDYYVQLKNIEISCKVVEIASELGCKRILFAGSVDEYEAYFNPDAPFILPSHSRIYGLSKFTAENIGKVIALNLGIEYVGVILSLTYGEGNKTNILPNTVIRKSYIGEPISLITGGNFFDMIYIEEAVQGILAAAFYGKNLESYFVGHQELQTFRKIVERMCEVIGSNSELRFGEYKDPDYIMDYRIINRSKLFKDTGYQCKANFAESLLKTKEWLMMNEKKEY